MSPVNGAAVNVQVYDDPLYDSRSGVTGLVNGTPGQLLLDRLLAGIFTLRASANGLSGTPAAGQPTQVVAGDPVNVLVRLQTQASISVVVRDQDGQTPATGLVYAIHSNGTSPSRPLVNGTALFSDLPLGTYSIRVYDSASRLRATAGGISLATNGETQSATLTFVALGTVKGQVIPATPGGNVGKRPGLPAGPQPGLRRLRVRADRCGRQLPDRRRRGGRRPCEREPAQ